jgi:hypothetical protein
MKTLWATTMLALGFLFLPEKPAAAQVDDQINGLQNALSGQRLLVTYRDGGALYGTYYFLDVQFCRTGRYFTAAQSRKTTVMDNEQVNNWREIGTWDIISVQNQIVLRYVSLNGRTNFVPAHLLSGGDIWLGDGVSVQRRGATACR